MRAFKDPDAFAGEPKILLGSKAAGGAARSDDMDRLRMPERLVPRMPADCAAGACCEGAPLPFVEMGAGGEVPIPDEMLEDAEEVVGRLVGIFGEAERSIQSPAPVSSPSRDSLPPRPAVAPSPQPSPTRGEGADTAAQDSDAPLVITELSWVSLGKGHSLVTAHLSDGRRGTMHVRPERRFWWFRHLLGVFFEGEQ